VTEEERMSTRRYVQEALTRRALALMAVGLGALTAAWPSAAVTPTGSDPKAVAVADRVMQALGGEAAWNATRYLRFDFAVDRGGKTVMRRAHAWDKWTGRYRVEGKDKDGREVVIAMNLNTKDGSATVAGAPLAGKALETSLETGYAWWVNDAYWLLMPYKMRDPGVVLTLAGQEKKGEDTWDKVLLTFEGVGLTPKDRYWAWVNAKTGLVDRWEFVLKGEKTPPVPFDWKGWKAFGRIQLANDRVNPDDGTRIHFPVLDVPAALPDEAFTLTPSKP
jgi:hypothetical protein